MATGNITKAIEGTIVPHTKRNKEPRKILPKCEHNTGFWYCMNHPKEGVMTQFDKDGHIHNGDHCLAWFCSSCGTYQVP